MRDLTPDHEQASTTTSRRSAPKRFVGEKAVAGVMKPVQRKLPRFLFLGISQKNDCLDAKSLSRTTKSLTLQSLLSYFVHAVDMRTLVLLLESAIKKHRFSGRQWKKHTGYPSPISGFSLKYTEVYINSNKYRNIANRCNSEFTAREHGKQLVDHELKLLKLR